MTELAAVSAVAVLSTLAFALALLRFVREERQRTAVERMNLLSAAHDREQDLLQRIQAPEHAVIARFNSEQPDDGVQAVNEFDDETYWLSREELAERVAEAEVNGGG